MGSSLIENSLASERPWLFLSPHLDDAVLSCGMLIAANAGKRPMTVATLFTESAPAPHTRAARSFMRQCRAHNAACLFEERRREDLTVLGGLGVRGLHVGAADALFRRRETLLTGANVWRRLPPELYHRYPTYRFDIARGRVSKGDRALISRLQNTVERLLEETEAQLLFCPVGVGHHVDHLIARTIGTMFPDRAIFYSDFPYNQSSPTDAAFVNARHLQPWTWSEGSDAKQRLALQYKTQAKALFPDGQIPTAPEVYFSPS